MKLVLKILLPLVILAGAIFGAKKLVESRPAPPTREVKKVIPTVQVATVKPATHRPEVRSYGTVRAYDETRLTPELTARIVELAETFRVGEAVEQGDVLVKLEKRDFEAALEARKAELAQLERQLAEEEILAEQAAADWVASGRPLESASDFRLRKPQLAALEAQIRSATAAIGTAELNLERTEIRAPFDARVASREANLGQMANPQTSLGTLIATARAEVSLPFTPEQLARVDAELSPDSLAASPLEVRLSAPEHEGNRQARIVRLDPNIDARNQVRYLIAELEDPFAAKPFSLPVGSFVNATLTGRSLSGTLRFTESALVEDSYVWIVDDESQLKRLEVERLATEDGEVIARPAGEPGEVTIVTRPLTTFRPGTPVKLPGKEAAAAAPAAAESEDPSN